MIDQTTIDRVAAAIDGTDVGFNMTLTRLVDGVSTYTLTMDGKKEEFGDTDDLYARVREIKQRKQAEAIVVALSPTPAQKNLEPHPDAIERMAKAIYEADDVWSAAFPWPTMGSNEQSADNYRRIARAALDAALNTPSPAQNSEGQAAASQTETTASTYPFRSGTPLLSKLGEQPTLATTDPVGFRKSAKLSQWCHEIAPALNLPVIELTVEAAERTLAALNAAEYPSREDAAAALATRAIIRQQLEQFSSRAVAPNSEGV